MNQDWHPALRIPKANEKQEKVDMNIFKQSSILNDRSAFLGSRNFTRPHIGKYAEAQLQKNMCGKKTPESPTPKSKYTYLV